MAISHRTKKEILSIIGNWQETYGISKVAVRGLFLQLSQVEGNRSFKDSIIMLTQALEEKSCVV
jgi:hypothetical protein